MVSQDEIDIVLTRLEQLMPPTVKLMVGGSGPYSKEELLNVIKEHTEIGKLVVESQMLYLRSFRNKEILETIRPKVAAIR